MKHVTLRRLATLMTCTLLMSCAGDNGLRKFDSGDISKELTQVDISKFEVKDVSELDQKPKTDIVAKKSKIKGAKVSKPIVPPLRRTEELPFTLEEKLFYDIRFVGVTAATFTMEMRPFKVVNDRKVFHLFGHCKTVKLFELVYRVDDKVESFWDYDGLYSHRLTMDLDETKQSRKLIELYDYERKKSIYWNRVDHAEKGFSEQKVENDIKLWSQDPLSLLYYIRVAKLPLVKGEALSIPIILDGKSWDAVLIFDRKEKILVGNKNYDANVYKLDNFLNGELKNKDNTVWISDDEKRYILRIEAKVKVGTFAIALDKIQ